MDIRELIKFEPIDITQIVITFGLAAIIIYAFKSQLNAFFASLENRPISVKMSETETTIELDSPVKMIDLVESIQNPQGSQEEVADWAETVRYVDNISGFEKLGFGDLYSRLSALGPGEEAVINFVVDDDTRNYFKDDSMLRYLSIASEKVRYLALIKDGQFVGALSIEDVISSLAAGNYRYANFGEQLKSGSWRDFPSLISRESSFEETPSVRDLYARLTESRQSEIPLLSDGNLIGFLNYRSISEDLYGQIADI